MTPGGATCRHSCISACTLTTKWYSGYADLTKQFHWALHRCLYKAVKPFRTFMDNVVAGSQLPVEPPEEKPPDDDDDFVPQVLISHSALCLTLQTALPCCLSMMPNHV